MTVSMVKISDVPRGTSPSGGSSFVDALWRRWEAWAEQVTDLRQNVIKYRHTDTDGLWQPIQTLDLGPSIKAVDPAISGSGSTLCISFRAVDRSLPADQQQWQRYAVDLPGLLPTPSYVKGSHQLEVIWDNEQMTIQPIVPGGA